MPRRSISQAFDVALRKALEELLFELLAIGKSHPGKCGDDSSSNKAWEAFGAASAGSLPLSERGEESVSPTGMTTASLLDGLIGRAPNTVS